MAQQGNSVFQFKISLQSFKPPTWRRVLVPGDYTFKDLHFVIQSIFNWSDTHMHKFDLKLPGTRETIEVGGVGDMGFGEWWPESKKLNAYFRKENDKATYDYDFGDTWYHTIVLEKFLSADPAKKYPQCIAGRTASPPEHVTESEQEELEYSVPGVFDRSLITFKNSRDVKAEAEEVQNEDLSSDEMASISSEFSDYEERINGNVSSKPDDPKQTLSGPKLAISSTKVVNQAIDNRLKSMNYLSKQNSNGAASSVLPQKRKLPEDEPKSAPAKRISWMIKTAQQEGKGSQNSSTSVLKMPMVSENSNPEPLNSNINVPSVTEDAEDYYGKFIASQMKDVTDLEKREELRIEIQKLISKYRFKN